MPNFAITAGQLLAALGAHGLLCSHTCDETLAIPHISYDSRSTAPGGLFVCKGFGFKPEFLLAAAQAGAGCYMAQEQFPEVALPAIVVSDVRKALAVAAGLYYNYPSKHLKLIGITGTKGKTTTSFYTRSILDAWLPKPSALLSTVEMYLGGEVEEAHLTTPESLELQACFAQAVQNNIEYLTMEVSSQAYKLHRVLGVDFAVGVFLNIDEDHIGPMEHSDFEDYLTCKLQLLQHCHTAIIHTKTREFDRVLQTAKAHARRVILIGEDEQSDYRLQQVEKLSRGFAFTVTAQGWSHRFSIDMEGRFNIDNALAAIATAKALGVPDDAIAHGVGHVEVKGRMNVFEKDGVKIIVDYAHNHLSFTELFKSLREDYPESSITTVVGCPGGKAYIRRRDIGRLCGQFANLVILTEEDPQHEDVYEICRDIAGYIEPYGKEYVIEVNRTAAVERAIRSAKPGDIVILAGKGEEVYQKVRGQYEYYESDLAIARRCAQEDVQ